MDNTSITGSPFPITDDNMVSSCIRAAESFCKERLSMGEFDSRKCSDSALAMFNLQYRDARKCGRSTALRSEHLAEMTSIYERLWPRIEQGVKEVSLKYAKKFKVRQMTQATAKAFISEAIKENGITDFNVVCQCYRAKVFLYQPSKYKTMFIVKYKDIMSGKLDDYVSRLLELKRTVEELPFEVRFWK